MSDEMVPPRQGPPRWAIGVSLVVLVAVCVAYGVQAYRTWNVPKVYGLDEDGMPLDGPAVFDSPAEDLPHLSVVAWRRSLAVASGTVLGGGGDPNHEPGLIGHRIRGVVQTADGEPLPDAGVAVNEAVLDLHVSDVTDHFGIFELAGTPLGARVTILVSHEDFGTAVFEGIEAPSESVVLTMESYNFITVTVVDGADEPVTVFEAGLWRGAVDPDRVDALSGLPFVPMESETGRFIVTDVTDDIITVLVRVGGGVPVYQTVNVSEGPESVTIRVP